VPIDPVAAALDALVQHFTERLGEQGLTARRGWPEPNVELDVDENRHVVSIAAAGERTTRLVSPRTVSTVGTSRLVVLWRIAELEFIAQIDLWCAYRSGRDRMVPLLEDAFHNRMPRQPGLFLSSDGYYSRPLTIDAGASRYQDAVDTASRGEWRTTWDVTIRTDKVFETTHPALTTVAIRAAIEAHGIEITEADVEVE
jgi:hypothetical protein